MPYLVVAFDVDRETHVTLGAMEEPISAAHTADAASITVVLLLVDIVK